MMQSLFRPFLLSLALIVVSAAPLRARSERIDFALDGLERHVILTVPDGLDRPAPLILALHGVLEDGASMQTAISRGRFDAFADRHGVVVAYPSAWGRVWSIGEGAAPLPHQRDDLAYLERVIEIAGENAKIDRDRIFIAGFSMGGMAGLSLACKRPGLVRAVATVASGLPGDLVDDCRAHPPDGVLVMHGTEDPIVPFAGGDVPAGLASRMPLLGFEATLAVFTEAKRCRFPPQETAWDAKDDDTRVIRLGWYRCARGAVEGYRIESGGHRWPSGGPFVPFTGIVSKEIDGAAAIWGFFSRFK